MSSQHFNVTFTVIMSKLLRLTVWNTINIPSALTWWQNKCLWVMIHLHSFQTRVTTIKIYPRSDISDNSIFYIWKMSKVIIFHELTIPVAKCEGNKLSADCRILVFSLALWLLRESHINMISRYKVSGKCCFKDIKGLAWMAAAFMIEKKASTWDGNILKTLKYPQHARLSFSF